MQVTSLITTHPLSLQKGQALQIHLKLRFCQPGHVGFVGGRWKGSPVTKFQKNWTSFKPQNCCLSDSTSYWEPLFLILLWINGKWYRTIFYPFFHQVEDGPKGKTTEFWYSSFKVSFRSEKIINSVRGHARQTTGLFSRMGENQKSVVTFCSQISIEEGVSNVSMLQQTAWNSRSGADVLLRKRLLKTCSEVFSCTRTLTLLLMSCLTRWYVQALRPRTQVTTGVAGTALQWKWWLLTPKDKACQGWCVNYFVRQLSLSLCACLQKHHLLYRLEKKVRTPTVEKRNLPWLA